MNTRPLWAHQTEAINKALLMDEQGFYVNPDLFLAMEMGTGKTRCVIEIMRRLYAREGRVMRTLIIAPIIVLTNWKNEIAMYSKIKPHDVAILKGTGTRRSHTFMDFCSDQGVLCRDKIIIMNPESLLMNDLMSQIELWKPEIIICDEAHVFKNHSSKRAKKMAPLADLARHRYMLTGTPILNSPQDIFMQYRILDGGQTFTKNFFSFRNYFFTDKNSAFAHKENHFPKWEPIKERFPEMQQKIHKKAFRAVKADCLDLPPLIRQTIEVDMSPEQRKMYEEMRKDFITWVQAKQKGDEPRAVIAQLAVTKSLRLQQIVSGYAKTDEGDIVWFDPNPRLKAVADIIETLGNSKVIIWAIFKENYKMLEAMCKKLGLEYAMINGDLTNKEKDENVEKFTKSPTCNVMIANQSAGGVGINLVESNYSLYFSKSFSIKDDLQSEARNYRGGSEMHDKVTRIDIVCPNSIDELINNALAMKQDIASVILDKKFTENL